MPRSRPHGVCDDILAGFGAGTIAAVVRIGQSQQVGHRHDCWSGSLFFVGLGLRVLIVPIPT